MLWPDHSHRLEYRCKHCKAPIGGGFVVFIVNNGLAQEVGGNTRKTCSNCGLKGCPACMSGNFTSGLLQHNKCKGVSKVPKEFTLEWLIFQKMPDNYTGLAKKYPQRRTILKGPVLAYARFSFGELSYEVVGEGENRNQAAYSAIQKAAYEFGMRTDDFNQKLLFCEMTKVLQTLGIPPHRMPGI